MAFPVRMISEKADQIEIDLDFAPKEAEFEDYMNLVAIVSDVDALVKFNSPENKPFLHKSNLVYNWFFPIKKIIAEAVNEKGKLYAWGEKI
ncbi:MAG: hypothetical protein QW734_07515 [Candidatus Bathyarchaeia archaeon]